MIQTAQGRGRVYHLLTKILGESVEAFLQELNSHLIELVLPSEDLTRSGLLVDTTERRYFGVGLVYRRGSANLGGRVLLLKSVDLWNPHDSGGEYDLSVGSITRLLSGLDLCRLGDEMSGLLAYMFSPTFDVRPHPRAVKAYQDRRDRVVEAVQEGVTGSENSGIPSKQSHTVVGPGGGNSIDPNARF
ncbi:MAG TPA: hypothetical protein VJB87_05715 [Candidatus Nanoarchaeia archaeon]|nr:hypothetical protein [Candidatus Nanoarchaeia archaeon]